MQMIDVYATQGTFADKHALALSLAAAVMRWEQVPLTPADVLDRDKQLGVVKELTEIIAAARAELAANAQGAHGAEY